MTDASSETVSWRHLADLACPRCFKTGDPETVLRYRRDSGRPITVRCEKCGFKAPVSEFEAEEGVR